MLDKGRIYKGKSIMGLACVHEKGWKSNQNITRFRIKVKSDQKGKYEEAVKKSKSLLEFPIMYQKSLHEKIDFHPDYAAILS